LKAALSRAAHTFGTGAQMVENQGSQAEED
jgi:hypothetical protein